MMVWNLWYCDNHVFTPSAREETYAKVNCFQSPIEHNEAELMCTILDLCFNSVAPGRCGSNSKSVIFKLIIQNCSLANFSHANAT